nr:hypothetical protein [Tanacetum cinerariifolium]
MFDCDDYLSSGSDESLPPSPIYDRYHSGNGYHVVPPLYTGTFMPLKPNLVFNNAPTDVKTDHHAFNVKLSHTKPDNDLSHAHRPLTPIIEDWVSDLEDESETKNRKACFVCKSLDHLIKDCDYHEKKMAQPTTRNHAKRGTHKQYAQMTLPNPQRHVVPAAVLTQSKLVLITAVRPVTTDVPKTSVTRPRQAKTVVTKPNSPPRRHINHSPSPKSSNFPPKVTAIQAPRVNAAKGNPQHALKDKRVIDSGCSRHMIGNMSYLSDFEKLNGGYVAFGENPKGGKISRKDENQVLLRVPRETNMYNVDLKNIVPSGDLTCLFAKATLDESNIWHRRLGHINFKTMNKLVKGKFDGKVDEGFLVGYSVSSKAFRVFNSRTRIIQETLHINFLENKPNVVGSGPTWLFDIDTLTKTMNYQPVTTGRITCTRACKKMETPLRPLLLTTDWSILLDEARELICIYRLFNYMDESRDVLKASNNDEQGVLLPAVLLLMEWQPES